jgi:hypothetical protein
MAFICLGRSLYATTGSSARATAFTRNEASAQSTLSVPLRPEQEPGAASLLTLANRAKRERPFYSLSPAASRASVRSMTLSMRITDVPRKVQTWK